VLVSPLLDDAVPPGSRSAPPSLFSRLAPIVWIDLAMLVGALYGILNDQITVTLAPEYFSVFKRQQFRPLLEAIGWTGAPARLQAIPIGAAATWWFGLILGMLVSLVGTVGRWPRLTTRGFVRAVGTVMATAAAMSLLCGAVAYLVEPLIPIASGQEHRLFESVFGPIHEWRRFFAVGWWHNGAYLGGMLGTMVACARVWKWRRDGGAPPPEDRGAV
jgi:hypothetical protein